MAVLFDWRRHLLRWVQSMAQPDPREIAPGAGLNSTNSIGSDPFTIPPQAADSARGSSIAWYASQCNLTIAVFRSV